MHLFLEIIKNTHTYCQRYESVWQWTRVCVCVGENMYMHTMCTCALLQLDLCVTECSNKHSMYMYVYMILTCTMYITSSIFVLIGGGTSVIIPAANLLYCRFYI